MKALYFNQFGDSDVLKYGDLATPAIDENSVLVKTEFIGLNFADIYRRRGNYHIEPSDPYINGYEASGQVVQVGAGLDKGLLGQSVLFVDVPYANAEYVKVPSEKLIILPTAIDTKQAATIGLQGLTADFLANDLGQNNKDDRVFITGISGGVGQILSQILSAKGVKVSGSVSTELKQQIALSLGASKVYLNRDKALWQPVLKGKLETVYDGVGSTLTESIELLKNKGKVIFFGMAGGNPENIDLIDLLTHSKSILTGDLWDYLSSFKERQNRSQRLFKLVSTGKINISEPTIFHLSEGQAAHNFLESGKSTGKVLMKV
ncbi:MULTISPECIES: zinc-binding dehydrogenase [unclassified Enterococcus]|uniref:zinc-binding dehydrogenase n=1 Tax=unclassified Enterococcus TaxID=2608891 RepID=UPI001551DB8C|nr:MULTISPECIES: zinc-binding dehydrogenase [unclassified Enterococcus]MBS7576480.1 zinc-binding dehydrogenase [Enterococcus sp. MMGLQ5-2]MBS7583712.1 zinc-binding dehydrogenase [Enterococcus sp. MMGLQ5-1]NPD11573.1 zinc-binding dehydrogenase [Enterococcus sp. MMGLQ5-1]NPD36317.1 zinc-binding dehydrogenase [Enterococcus sp. MMGLQ5-2]